MPEGPELHLASLYVNKMCQGLIFTGAVRKSEVSKAPDVPFTCEAYRITAASRGKEVKLTLTPMKSQGDQPMDIVFRFGMSGYFRLTTEDELPKHSHLRFYSNEEPCRVLSFVDTRSFGSWQPGGTWQPSRGPCVITEYKSFRSVLMRASVTQRTPSASLTRPLSHREKVLQHCRTGPLTGPSVKSCSIKSTSTVSAITSGLKSCSGRNKRVGIKEEKGDLLRLCHTVPLEVVDLGGTFYDSEKEDYSDFKAWLQCYCVDGMKSARDHNGRTVWFKGDPGPMAPKG
ncbi:unnamed protein product, partial [Tetraodon nigroviridis]